jgi:hypothetical protein
LQLPREADPVANVKQARRETVRIGQRSHAPSSELLWT